MAVNFKVPASPSKSVITSDNFLGCDFTNSSANMDLSKSPNCVNMIRDVPGKVRKCMGYELIESFDTYSGDIMNANTEMESVGSEGGDICFWYNPTTKSIAVERDGEMPTSGTDYVTLDIDTNIDFFRHLHNKYGDGYIDKDCLVTSGSEIPAFYNFIVQEVSANTYRLKIIMDYSLGTGGVDLPLGEVVRTYVHSYEEKAYGNFLKGSSCDYNYYFPGSGRIKLTIDGDTGVCRYTIVEKLKNFSWRTSLTVDQSEVDSDLLDLMIDKYQGGLVDSNDLVVSDGAIPSWFSFYVSYMNDTYSIVVDAHGDSTQEIGKEYSFTIEAWSNTRINGYHKFRDDDAPLIHVGDKLYWNSEVVYGGLNNHISKSWQFNNTMFLIDGKKIKKIEHKDPTNDTVFEFNKFVNNVFVNQEVGMYIIPEILYEVGSVATIIESATDSPNGRFVIEDNLYVKYIDTLTTTGQIVSFSCKYNITVNGHTDTYITGQHYLAGISSSIPYQVIDLENDSYIPLITIGKKPDGTAGTSYEDINLISKGFKESFAGDGTSQVYHLSFTNIESVYVEEFDGTVQQWFPVQGGYVVNLTRGTVTFSSAPPVSPVTGEDNIRITAFKTFDGYADRINHCTIGALFGVNGASDRLFLSGNPDYPNQDWFCAQNDPTYFADTSYSALGSSNSAIVGYSIVNNYLAAHKDKYEREQNIIVREGDLVENEPVFRIINTLQGAGACAPNSFAYLQTEPLFLTEQGVYAVTAQDITGEKYAQNRSFFLDGKLLKEKNLENAFGFVYNDMYWLCLNGVAYILDGLQAMQTDKQKPYATRQYAGFYRTNLPARIMWEQDGRLFFGTEDGKIYRFFNDKYALNSYNDNGRPIECVWDTPDIIGKLFFKNKTLRHVAIKLDSAIATSVNIYVMNKGIWEFVRKDDSRGRYLSFQSIVFSKFSFSGDETQHTIPTKVRVKKVDKFRLKLINDELNEPFALHNLGFEYIETNNYKG